MSEYFHTLLETSSISQKDQNSNKTLLKQLQQFLNAHNFLIAVDDDLIVAGRNIQTVSGQIILTAHILSRNGSPSKFHLTYQKIFKKFFNSTPNVNFSLYYIQDHFSVQLLIKYKLIDTNSLIQGSLKQQMGQILKKYKKWLMYMGQLKKKNSFCLQMSKKSLKLKADLFDTLMVRPKQQIQPVQKFQQNNQNIYQLSSVKQAKNPYDRAINLKSKNNRISISKKLFDITYLDGRVQTVNLAQKKVKTSKEQVDQAYYKKIDSQLNLIKMIKIDKYLLKYYIVPHQKGKFYMEYIQKCLKQVIYQSQIGINQIFKLSKQLIEAIRLLHLSGVTHRDLKLENILVKQVNGQKQLKIIDFGESSIIGSKYGGDHTLGATLPYSPIQCILQLQEGFNRAEIDLWSILVIIYQMIYKQLPLFFCYDLRMEIAQGWRSPNNFSLMLNLCPRKGLTKIEQYIGILMEEGIRIEQKQRLSLRTINQVLESIINFQKAMDIVFQQYA